MTGSQTSPINVYSYGGVIWHMSQYATTFLFLFVVVNTLLVTLVVRPVRRLAAIADQVSLGTMDAPEFLTQGDDEIAALGRSFNRMRRSLVEALNLLQ